MCMCACVCMCICVYTVYIYIYIGITLYMATLRSGPIHTGNISPPSGISSQVSRVNPVLTPPLRYFLSGIAAVLIRGLKVLCSY